MTSSHYLTSIIRRSPILHLVLNRWSSIALPNCWVSGSAIAQTVWNASYGFPADHGLVDIDLVYFDDSDLSARREEMLAQRVRSLVPGLPVWIDAKNEARVHLWYADKFGYEIPPYMSVEQAIATFPTTAGAVAVRPSPAGLEIFAPFGLADMLGCTVRPNKAQITRSIYEAKVARWRAFWPELTIVPWDDDNGPLQSGKP
ncbi:nucleotidyltransferase family protein [Sphingobium sp. Sx8-8]|uniref:nucleotidyltransferase family protein n=1 Tax=Sphingobium sp. Sx8-8 TaxID=2933617 RepID=UPI001F58CC8D|nr:nucleotidyltransferase family protein [Sphingobium sp. Sx8-8]